MSQKPPFKEDQSLPDEGFNDFSQEMPSVTRLLNRKKLGMGSTSAAIAAPAAPPPKVPPPGSLPPSSAKPLAPPPASAPTGSERTSSGHTSATLNLTLEPVSDESPVNSEEATMIASLPELGLPILEPAGMAPVTEPLDLSEQALSAQNNAPAPRAPAPAPVASAPSPKPTAVASASPSAPRAVKVQTATRRMGAAGNKPLTDWRLSALRSSSDSVERCAADLLDQGANSTLWLLAQPLAPGQQLPTFLASAGLSPPGRVALWTGMNWNPKTAPDLWNAFVRAGYLELGPPSGETLPRSSRTAVRKALGASPDEYLLLLRAGPANAARGILAVFAFKSLIGEAADMIERINSAAGKAA